MARVGPQRHKGGDLFVTGVKEQRFLVSTTHCGKLVHNVIKSDEYCRDVRISAGSRNVP
jgi:hypothetical protein